MIKAGGMTQYNKHWSRPVLLCLVNFMNIIKAIKSGDSIEFIAEDNGYRIHGILARGNYFNWISFPELNVSCELASFDDDFWNEESLCSIFKSSNQIEMILDIIKCLKHMFEDDINYFDGHKFISTREYIFWLETECEMLSQQLIEIESKINCDEIDKWLKHLRIDYYKYMREQYDKDAFLD